jgi:protein-tyrosine phosphatase
MSDRIIPLAGAHNARDLGGLPTGDGRTTAFGRLLRAEFTDLVAEGDLDLLVHRIGLRTVVDLRRRGAARHESVPWHEHGVMWVNCPFGLGRGAAVANAGADFVEVYLGYLETDPATVVNAVETLLDPANHPAMLHCAAGKDRTGVLAALLLDVLGVGHAAIAEDYAMSAGAVAPVLARLSAQAPYREMLRDYDVAAHMPDPDVMLAFLRRLQDTHGGARGWLLGHGVDGRWLDAFAESMLSSAPRDPRPPRTRP